MRICRTNQRGIASAFWDLGPVKTSEAPAKQGIGSIRRRLKRTSGSEGAFTLAEVMVGASIVLITLVTFYTAITACVWNMQLARENLGATQIMVNRLEGIRLFNWAQLTNTSIFPTNFTTNFMIASGTNFTQQGPTYTGTVTLGSVPFSSSYNSNMQLVTIQLAWTNGNVQRVRQMSTYFALNGIENYVKLNTN
jgi:hypothetical protein